MMWMVLALAALGVVLAGWCVFGYAAKHLRKLTSHKQFTRAPALSGGAANDFFGSRNQRQHPRRKPDWVVAEVLRLKAHMGKSGCRQVAATFNRLHRNKSATVGKSFVAHCIQANQYALQCLRTDMQAKLPRPVAVNTLWAMDLTFCTDIHGKPHVALGLLDHGSRVLTRLHVLASKSSWTLLGHLCFAIAQHGKPKTLRTDNEAVFTSTVFKTFLQLTGIRHQRIQTCAPWQNGRIERLFGTLKPLLRPLVIPNAHALQNALQEFALFYNHVRPHQNLQGLTPAEKWQGYSPIDIAQRPPKNATLVQALHGWCVGYYLRR